MEHPAIPTRANQTSDHYVVVSRLANCCAIDDASDLRRAYRTMNSVAISFDHQPKIEEITKSHEHIDKC